MAYIKHNENSKTVLVNDITIRQDMFPEFCACDDQGIIKTYKDTKMYSYSHQSCLADSLRI